MSIKKTSPNISFAKKTLVVGAIILLSVTGVDVLSNTSVDSYSPSSVSVSSHVEDTPSPVENSISISIPEPIPQQPETVAISVQFSSYESWESHFDKHKHEFDFASKEDYLQGANNMLAQTDLLTKKEDDGDDLYYREITNEFAVVSTDGYLRTYFKPNDGIAYFNRK